MNITAFRIVKRIQVAHAFNGEGARLYGGRGNAEGIPIIYCAGSRALAGLEVLVHLPSPLLQLDFMIIETQFDSRFVQQISIADLPPGWQNDQPVLATKNMGNQWAKEGNSLVLAVPSTIIPEEPNYLINPEHPDFKAIQVGQPQEFSFDQRLTGGF